MTFILCGFGISYHKLTLFSGMNKTLSIDLCLNISEGYYGLILFKDMVAYFILIVFVVNKFC